MKKLFAIISLFALVLTSCEKEETIVIGSNFDTITATIESAADTKAALQNGTNTMNVVWESGDYISIFFKIGDVVKNVKYHLSSGDGTTTGTFEKAENVDLTNAEFLATVYPYTQNAAYDAATKTISGLTMAASYQYNPNKMTTQAPMAYVGSVNTISFKNAASLVQVTTSNVPSDYTSVVLSSTASKLSGNYKISFNNNNEPVATLTGDNSNGSTVTFTGTGADQTIYFPILPESYSDLAVTLNGTNVVPIELIAPRELVAARNNCYYTSIPVTTMTETTVELTNSYTTQEDIQILDFTDVTTGDITVTGNSVTDKITIVATNESSTPRELNIDLPSATVEVTGSSTYSTITASTAENTLILGDGVNVTKVIVNKGNIRVNNGAVLNGIQLGNSVTSVKVIDNGGTIANEVKNTSGVTVITGLEADIAAAEDGETVYMTQDVTLDNILTIDKNITLDGNGFTLTSTATRAINVDCSDVVIIKNLTIKTTSSGYSNSNTERAINVIQQPVTLTLDNVKATGFKYTINVAKSSVGSNITISGGEYSGYAAMNITGNDTEVKATGVIFNGINDATLNESNNYAVISIGDAQDSDVTDNVILKITDGTLSASSTKGNRQAAIQLSDATNVDISVDAELSLCDKFVLFNELSAGTVSFRNDYEDELIAQGYITTAADNNMFDVSFVPVSNAGDLSTAVNNGGNVVLLDDITLSEHVSINAPTYLNLNNKTVTANCKKAFEVYADATIDYGKIVSQQRCVDTRAAVKLTLYDVDLESKDYYSAHGNQQPLTIGGSQNGTIVNMHKVNIDAGTTGYGIISFVKTTLTAAESEISGYSALYVKSGSAGSEFNFSKSLLSGTTGDNDVEGNSFSTIAVRDNNVNLTLDSESTLISLGNYHSALSFGGDYPEEESTSGVVATVAGTITATNILSEESVNSNTIYVKSDYSAQLQAAGFTTTAAENGLIKVTVTVQ
ncbi:MAG: hypothetical protein IJE52_00505 [Bacteroidales bacterium]|nr:hypothetical protein [Bacteroidales bacterium]